MKRTGTQYLCIQQMNNRTYCIAQGTIFIILSICNGKEPEKEYIYTHKHIAGYLKPTQHCKLAMLLLLLLSCFSHVRLCATPQTAAQQAPPSLGSSRQERWSRLPFPSPMRESEVAQSCLNLRDPMDCSPPGSSIHGIFQASVLEWGAIAFSVSQLYFSLKNCLEKRIGTIMTKQT